MSIEVRSAPRGIGPFFSKVAAPFRDAVQLGNRFFHRHFYDTTVAIGSVAFKRAISPDTSPLDSIIAGVTGVAAAAILGCSRRSAFISAVENNDVDTVRAMLDDGFELRASNGSLDFPIYIAIQSNHLEMVKLLVSKQGKSILSSLTADSRTPIQLALQTGASKRILQFLSRHTPRDTIIRPDRSLMNTLHWAARKGLPEITQELSNRVMIEDLGIQDEQRRTALHWAIYDQNNEDAAILIQKMDIDHLRLKDSKNLTAREAALKNGNLEMVAAIDDRINDFDDATLIKTKFFNALSKEPNFKVLKKKHGLRAILQAVLKLEGNPSFIRIKKPESIEILPFVQEILEKDHFFIPEMKTAGEYLDHYSAGFRYLEKERQTHIIEYLRRLNKYELTCFLNKLNRFPALSKDQIHSLQRGNWSHPIFKHPHLQEYALREFISGNLDVSQISEILIYDECTSKDEYSNYSKVMPLYTNGVRNDSTIQFLKDSLKKYYSDEDVEKFVNDPEVLNAQIYAVPIIPQSKVKSSVLHQIVHRLGHTFLIHKEGGIHYQIVMSPRFMGKLLSAKFGMQAPRLNPVLGASISLDNFRDPTKRDVLVPCRLFPQSQPKNADGFSASYLEFWHHDAVYHSYLGALNPHRAAFVELASLFDKSSDSKSKQIQIRLLDQEFAGYRLKQDLNISFHGVLHSLRREFPTQVDQIYLHIEQNRERWEKEFEISIPKWLRNRAPTSW